MTIPGNPEYFSLNVASAIQVFAYQNFILNNVSEFDNDRNDSPSFDELESFYKHLEQVLEHLEYFQENRPKELLMRRLRRFFNRAEVEKEELAIFRGIIKKIKPFDK